jgi:hypothetical protein
VIIPYLTQCYAEAVKGLGGVQVSTILLGPAEWDQFKSEIQAQGRETDAPRPDEDARFKATVVKPNAFPGVLMKLANGTARFFPSQQ